jgi:PIN domain nuclease of toxin-antitoxin system
MAKTKKKFLVDTQVFVWIFTEPKRFSNTARAFLKATENNDFYLSHVSSWEISIKYGIGKLQLPQPPEEFIPERLFLSEYVHLPIALDHIFAVRSLPTIHRDPFDRLLVSQAKVERMTLLTSDRELSKYDIKTLQFSDLSK